MTSRLKSAFQRLSSSSLEWPCLSFDAVADELSDGHTEYPLACCLVGGTQAEKTTSNELIVMRLSNLHPIEGLFLVLLLYFIFLNLELGRAFFLHPSNIVSDVWLIRCSYGVFNCSIA